MSERPTDALLGNILSPRMAQQLEERDQEVRQYYLGLNDANLRLFDELLLLHAQLMASIGNPVPGFIPKFPTLTDIQRVVAISAAGSFRSLRLAHKLLLEAYHLEMATLLRMVEQWLEAAVIVEFCPAYAREILGKGVSQTMIDNVSKSYPEAKGLFKMMTKTFSKLSQRAHVTKTSIRLVREPKADSDRLYLTGTMHEELLRTDALALTVMCLNSIKILLRHFERAPESWHQKLKQIESQIAVR